MVFTLFVQRPLWQVDNHFNCEIMQGTTNRKPERGRQERERERYRDGRQREREGRQGSERGRRERVSS